MKSLRIARNGLQRDVARSKKGVFSMKESRTRLTMFVMTFGATILLAGVWVQIAVSAPGGGGKGGKGGNNVPHMVHLSGDITSVPKEFNLDPDNPLGKLSLDGFQVTFPEFTSGVGCGSTSGPDPFVSGWGGYATYSPWTGTLSLQRTRQGGSKKWHFGYLATNPPVGGSINLVVQQAEEDVVVTSPEEGTTTLSFGFFFDKLARGLVSGASSPDGAVDGNGNVITDSDNRCLTFTITAIRNP